ncbi:protein kinase [Kitasatospora sp. NPDC018058]|uniref:serine/threonine-protein kinase n=1 Tax=Kitasatospora sp. NPDC018058 TaxID=3364025 RepID=UPI0037BF0942
MTGARLIAGRYRLTEKIGRGGMGQVWAAQDERLHRPVAVKLLRPEHLLPGGSGRGSGAGAATTERRRHGDELSRRFLRECRVTAALDHPGLVTVFDAGEDEDEGELYLVMQRVPGASLADLIAEDAPFPVERAVAVAAQLCGALAAVHAIPVVHRDLKPSNVMVRADGRTVLLDLGVATALDTETTRLTLTGVPIGSPAYMAPEQALAATTDPRSDLYSLGCLLHEMLSGEEPFRAPTALGVLRRHVDEPPVPLRELRPEVPQPLERLVLDLLAKQPADRPAAAQAVYGRLLPLLPPAEGAPQPRFTPLPDPARPFRYPHQPEPSAAVVRPEPRPFLIPPAPSAPPAVPVAAPVAVSSAPDLGAECARLSDLVDAGRHTEVLGLAARLLPRAEADLGERAPLVRAVRTIYARILLHEGTPSRPSPSTAASPPPRTAARTAPRASTTATGPPSASTDSATAPTPSPSTRPCSPPTPPASNPASTPTPSAPTTSANASASTSPPPATPRTPGTGSSDSSSNANAATAPTTPPSAASVNPSPPFSPTTPRPGPPPADPSPVTGVPCRRLAGLCGCRSDVGSRRGRLPVRAGVRPARRAAGGGG